MDELLSTPLQAGAFALALVVLAILARTMRVVLKMLGSAIPIMQTELNAIRAGLDRLPCVKGEVCPVREEPESCQEK